MEGRRFDEIARTLGSGASRRRAIRTVAGGAVAAVLARFGGGEAAAGDCKKRLERCQSRRDCCGADKGRTACRDELDGMCSLSYPGFRCCGLEGSTCSPNT